MRFSRHIPFPEIQENGRLMVNQGYFYSTTVIEHYGVYNEIFTAMPSASAEKPTAIPEVSVAIRDGSPNAQNAYYFIKHLLSPAIQMDIGFGCPVLLEQIYYHSRHHKDDTAKEQARYEVYTNVVPYRQFSPKLWEIYVQYMTPYWEGNASYEDCVTDLESMLELYMYE